MATTPTAASPQPLGLGGALRQLARSPLSWLLLALPVAAWLHATGGGALATFLAAALAVIPLAGVMGRSTESLAELLGPGPGGFLNATLGNAAELILALFALTRGPDLYPLVKASLTGSIIGNILLVMGAAIVAGGLRYPRQRFDRRAAGMAATLLALACFGLVMPAVYFHIFRARSGVSPEDSHRIELLSEEIAGILAVVYLLSLVFTFVTHRTPFGGEAEGHLANGASGRPEWRGSAALILLVASTAGIAWMSEVLTGTVEQAGRALGTNEVFVGAVIVAVIGNAAEHSTAVRMALYDKMDAALQIAVGSGIQVALFVAPVLVFASMAVNPGHPLDLHFSLLETVTLVFSVGVLALVCQDGETHWMEGVLLLAAYAIAALAFFNFPY
jgi:Ca2+:H+ antiporter